MEPAVYRSTARRRDSRHGTAITPFSAWQGGACVWRVGVLKADGTLDDLYGVTSIVLRISSYGGTSPGAFSWVARTVPAAEFLTPTSAAAVQAGTEWHAEVQLTEEETNLPVDDSGTRPYWWEWRAVTAAGEVPLSAGQMIVRGSSGRAGGYALSSDISGESAARQAGDEQLGQSLAAVAGQANATDTRVDGLATDMEGKAEASDVEAIAADVATITATDLPGKAAKDLTNAVSEAVTTRLIAPAAVTIDKLDPAVRSALSGGLDPALFVDNWNAATNTPTIPAASGNNGKWYHVNTGGVATGNAPGTYVQGDRIVSIGTAWKQLKVPATVIPDGSLSRKALSDTQVYPDAQLATGRKVVRGWATKDGTENILSFDEKGRITPDPAAGVSARVDAIDPKVAKLGEGLLPRNWVEGTEIWEDGAWIMDGENRVHLIRARATADRSELIEGVSSDGTRYPKNGGGTSDYVPADYIVFGQEAGGLGISDADGERTIIDESATWKDLQPTEDEEVWIGRSNRLTGAYGAHKVNIFIPTVFSLNPKILYGFGVTGQSLAHGWTSIPLLSTTAVHPDHNLMFNGGMFAGGQNVIINPDDMASFVPMKEVFYSASAYESPWSGCFNRLNTLLNQTMGGRVRFHCANHSWGGRPYTDIKKGKRAYNNGLYEIARAKALANAAGWDYVYLGTLMIHGENDRVLGTSAATYDGYLKELLSDTAADVMAITGQSFYPLLFTDGCHSWTSPPYLFTDPTVTLGQLSAAMTESRIIMVGPKYIHPHNTNEGIHLPALSSRLVGECFANAVAARCFGGGRWNPFGPVEIGQTSDTVWARMQTPLGHSLAFDTSLVTDPGRYGFELAGASFAGDPVIDGDRIVIPKSGTATQLRYAYTGISGAYAGPLTGPRGCLRDTSPAVSVFTSAAMHNYCNTFSEIVPPAP